MDISDLMTNLTAREMQKRVYGMDKSLFKNLIRWGNDIKPIETLKASKSLSQEEKAYLRRVTKKYGITLKLI